jgi:RNA polymerase sigma factor (sigma-70 family)
MAWRRIHLVADATFPLQLVTRAEAAAFEAALGPLIEPAHRLATAMLHDSAAAQDVVQEASIKAWRKLDRLRPGSELRPWYMGIVANECRSTLRSRWYRSVVPLQGQVRGADGPEDATVAAQDTLRVMRTLRHKDRLVLALHFYLDMTVEDIAEVLGTSAPAAKARLYRAIHALRSRLGDREAPS